MESLVVLEEKIKMLVALVKNSKVENSLLQSENSFLKNENVELKTENARLAECNAQLLTQLRTIEDAMLLETGHVKELKEECSVTRLVLDDLLKSIDSIVENEN